MRLERRADPTHRAPISSQVAELSVDTRSGKVAANDGDLFPDTGRRQLSVQQVGGTVGVGRVEPLELRRGRTTEVRRGFAGVARFESDRTAEDCPREGKERSGDRREKHGDSCVSEWVLVKEQNSASNAANSVYRSLSRRQRSLRGTYSGMIVFRAHASKDQGRGEYGKVLRAEQQSSGARKPTRERPVRRRRASLNVSACARVHME